MVLAAGHGRRLRPLTDHLPKPLVPILGRPLLEIVADKLRDAGVRRLVVNAHHLADRIVAAVGALEGFERVETSVEPQILGTGGGIARARPLFGEPGRILLHNGDIWTDAPLDGLLRRHAEAGAAATLLLVPNPATDSVLLGRDGTVRAVAGRPEAPPRDGDRLLTYAGVAVLERRFLDLLPDGPSSLVPALQRAAADPALGVAGWAPAGMAWNDLGTVAAYLDLHERLLVGGEAPGRVAPDACIAPDVTFRGWHWIGPGAVVGEGAELADVVVWPGGIVPAGVRWRRRVVGRGWSATPLPDGLDPLLDAAGLPAPRRSEPVPAQGSDRSFWRVTASGRSAILHAAAPDDPEFKDLVACADFLHRHGLGGPAVLAVDRDRGLVLLEDLGDVTLERACRSEPDRTEELYGRVLDLLVALQTRGTDAVADCPPAAGRVFAEADLAWERDYFLSRFLKETAGLDPATLEGVAAELAAVSARVATQPRVLMHRDFQSRNIHLVEGTPRLVDVQGLRLGPLGYDLMSLLRDPYHAPDAAQRARLLERYRRALAAVGGPDLAADALGALACAAAVQRLAQALGAYGYLSRVKGKAEFARHVPAALTHLEEELRWWRRLSVPPGPLTELEGVVARLRRRW